MSSAACALRFSDIPQALQLKVGAFAGAHRYLFMTPEQRREDREKDKEVLKLPYKLLDRAQKARYVRALTDAMLSASCHQTTALFSMSSGLRVRLVPLNALATIYCAVIPDALIARIREAVPSLWNATSYWAGEYIDRDAFVHDGVGVHLTSDPDALDPVVPYSQEPHWRLSVEPVTIELAVQNRGGDFRDVAGFLIGHFLARITSDAEVPLTSFTLV